MTPTTGMSTATMQFTVGVNPGFVSTKKSLADVTGGKIEPGGTLTQQPGVPAGLTALFQTKNPGRNILYVGKANRDGDMNAVLTDKMFRYQSWPVGRGVFYKYYGAGAAGPTPGLTRTAMSSPVTCAENSWT